MNKKNLGSIKIIEIVDNENGTCSITYEVPDLLKKELKVQFGWKRWSSKKFNDFFLEALTDHAKKMETESTNNIIDNHCCIDVPDLK